MIKWRIGSNFEVVMNKVVFGRREEKKVGVVFVVCMSFDKRVESWFERGDGGEGGLNRG